MPTDAKLRCIVLPLANGFFLLLLNKADFMIFSLKKVTWELHFLGGWVSFFLGFRLKGRRRKGVFGISWDWGESGLVVFGEVREDWRWVLWVQYWVFVDLVWGSQLGFLLGITSSSTSNPLMWRSVSSFSLLFSPLHLTHILFLIAIWVRSMIFLALFCSDVSFFRFSILKWVLANLGVCSFLFPRLIWKPQENIG